MTAEAAGGDDGMDVETFRARGRELGLEDDEIEAELSRAREAEASGQPLAVGLDEALKEIAVRMGHEG